MRIYRIFLRNYRVFEEPLDLELPSGLIGVYGPNGGGKSYLVEAIPWILYGKSRTSVQDVRTSGAEGDCIAEMEFQHEDHLYRARRSVSPGGSVKAKVWADNEVVAVGVRDANRFVHSVLGVDIDAFRASVFAEQKQLSSFSDSSPADRQRLVLSLLGITPLDKARDLARSDARAQMEQLKVARLSLPDISEFVAERDECARMGEVIKSRLNALDARALELECCADRETRELARLDGLRVRSEQIIAVGKEKRRFFDELSAQLNSFDRSMTRLGEIEVELESLASSESRVHELEDRVASVRGELDGLTRKLQTQRELEGILRPLGCESLDQLEKCRDELRVELKGYESELDRLNSEIRSAQVDLISSTSIRENLVEKAELLAGLGSASLCPTCGQELGQGFEVHLKQTRLRLSQQVTEVDAKELALSELRGRHESLERFKCSSSRELEVLETGLTRARLLGEIVASGDVAVSVDGKANELRVTLNRLEEAKASYAKLVRLTAEKNELVRMVTRNSMVLETYQGVEKELKELKASLAELGFDPRGYKGQLESVEESKRQAGLARKAFDAENLRAVELSGRLKKAEALIEQCRQSQAVVEELESQSKVLVRVADYLNEFRRSTIASVGPRLAVTSASLFSELTESEYDQLEVDTSSWQLRISDRGSAHDLGRFSGSERDLANLAFRIAISEQIGHNFGQNVGLLVLDEVFGPLDDQRKYCLLGALDSLKARFNQVLVVTHGLEIKEQLPSAIEVVKLGQRRATARVVA